MRTLLFCFLFAPVGILTQNPYSTQERELIELNEWLYTTYVLDHNTAPLEKTATDDFKLIAGIGIVENKKQAIAGVKNLDVSAIKVLVDEVVIKNKLGIVIGSIELNGTIMGRPVPNKMRFSSVFILDNGQWRLQLRTMTPMRMKKS